MTLKNVFIKLILIALVVIIFFLVVFYFGSQPKIKGISEKFPYNKIVQNEFKTEHICYVFLNKKNSRIQNPYCLEMDVSNLSNEIDKVYKIPIGTFLRINDAKSVRKPVSGVMENLVFGTVFIQELNQKVAFEFYWGENPTYGLYDHDENYDIYDLAPWQETALPFRYFWDGSKKPHDWKTWKENN